MIKRYTWEDALIAAQAERRISNGGLLVALKVSKAITWEPKDGRPSGLYWKNEDALASVGCGRSTYFKHRDELFTTGFFVEVRDNKGRINICPAIPESTVETIPESLVETIEEKSTVETAKVSSRDSNSPQDRLEKSTGDNPYSVDIHCRDNSVDNSVDTSLPAAPVDITSSPNYEVKEEEVEIIWDIEEPSLTTRYVTASDTANLRVTEAVQSTVETMPQGDETMQDRMAKVLEFNKEMRPHLTSDWNKAWEICSDPDFLPNVADCGVRLEAAVKKVNEMEWATW